MDTFASVWDVADGAEADQALRALTAARIQVTPVWSFLAVATTPEEFQHRFALVEDRVRESAADHGVGFDVLAKSLVDDFRATAAFYVKDGDKEVGGPYDSKSDAQDAISGGDVSGDDLTVSGSGDNDDDGNDSDGDGKDEDDDNTDEDSDSGSDDDPDDDASDDDGKDDNPFAKKKAAADGVKYDCSCKKKSMLDEAFPVITLTAQHSVVHQPGETVFVDHFMGHDEHEGRKGVWAQVVASPGQHPHADRADSHLLKPMAPGGTHFFHHFGSLAKTAANDAEASQAESERRNFTAHDHEGYFSEGVGSYSHGDTLPDRPHHVYDSLGSAARHLEPRELAGYGHCQHCDHVFNESHPDAQSRKTWHTTCLNCGATDIHDNAADNLHESSQPYDDNGPDYHGLDGDNYGDPYGRMDRHHEAAKTTGAQCRQCGKNMNPVDAQVGGGKNPICGQCARDNHKKTALADGEDALALVISTVPGGEGQAEAEVHHETQTRTASLIERFTSVYNEFATE